MNVLPLLIVAKICAIVVKNQSVIMASVYVFEYQTQKSTKHILEYFMSCYLIVLLRRNTLVFLFFL